jgi:outer membrane protein assembly factor BamB
MDEYRNVLERIGDRVSMAEPAFERLRRRRDRRSRIDRVVAVSVGLVLAAAATGVVVRAFDASDRPRPASLGPETVSELDLAWVGTLGQPEAEFGTGVATASSPVVENDIVYVGSADRRLYAFEATCGQGGEKCDPLWTATTSDRIASTPAVAGGVVYVASQDGGLYAFPAECSSPCEPLWTASIGGYVRRGSPVVAGGIVYMMSQRTVGQQQPNDPTSLYAYPAECGTVGAYCEAMWKAFEGRVSYSTPSVHDGFVYAPMGDGVYVFRADCGTEGSTCQPLWRARGFAPLFASVAIAADRVFVADADRLVALPSTCDGARCGPVWVSRSRGTAYSALTANDGMVFVGTTSFPHPQDPTNTLPALLAFSADCVPPGATGECDPVWRGTGMEGFVEAPPTAAEGLVFIAMNSSDLESGVLYAFDQECGREAGRCEPLWSEPIDGTTGLSSPAVADGVVYLSAGGKLLAFDLRSGPPSARTWLPIAIVGLVVLLAAVMIWLRRRMVSTA